MGFEEFGGGKEIVKKGVRRARNLENLSKMARQGGNKEKEGSEKCGTTERRREREIDR